MSDAARPPVVVGARAEPGHSNIKDRNFDSCEITRFSWVPDIHAVLVDNPDLAPQRGGEPTITAVAPMIANALFDATGVRIFRLPLTPERVTTGMSVNRR